MDGEKFRETILSYFKEFAQTLATDQGDWVVKGFIDVYRNIYTISVDTKVVSKVIELMLFPVISRFATENNYTSIRIIILTLLLFTTMAAKSLWI
jgi:hypothetical protein